MKVGYFAPLPPERTGVADYAAALLTELRKLGPVEVAPSRCDVAFYQLGNNGLHAGIYRRALETPGVALLHDAVLHHFLLGQLDRAEYIEEFVYNYGEWNRGLAVELWASRASSGSDRRYFDYPMLRRVAEKSLTVVVHNPAAAQVVRKHAPGARVMEIPHLYANPPVAAGGVESIRLRERWGVHPAAFLFGVFGYLRETKRVMEVLDAFTEIHREFPQTALLIGGQFVSSDLERAVRPLLSSDGIIRQPHFSDHDFWRAAGAVDACINLRYPTGGETSGIAVRLMGLGKAVLLTDSLEISEIPEDACLRIPAGICERDSLRAHMALLAGMPQVAEEVGRRAAAYIQQHHRVERVAAQFWEVLMAGARSSKDKAIRPPINADGTDN